MVSRARSNRFGAIACGLLLLVSSSAFASKKEDEPKPIDMDWVMKNEVKQHGYEVFTKILGCDKPENLVLIASTGMALYSFYKDPSSYSPLLITAGGVLLSKCIKSTEAITYWLVGDCKAKKEKVDLNFETAKKELEIELAKEKNELEKEKISLEKEEIVLKKKRMQLKSKQIDLELEIHDTLHDEITKQGDQIREQVTKGQKEGAVQIFIALNKGIDAVECNKN